MQVLAAVSPSSRPGRGSFRRSVGRATLVPAPAESRATRFGDRQLGFPSVGRCTGFRPKRKDVPKPRARSGATAAARLSPARVTRTVRGDDEFRHRDGGECFTSPRATGRSAATRSGGSPSRVPSLLERGLLHPGAAPQARRRRRLSPAPSPRRGPGLRSWRRVRRRGSREASPSARHSVDARRGPPRRRRSRGAGPADAGPTRCRTRSRRGRGRSDAPRRRDGRWNRSLASARPPSRRPRTRGSARREIVDVPRTSRRVRASRRIPIGSSTAVARV
jgi:hypothetical protein